MSTKIKQVVVVVVAVLVVVTYFFPAKYSRPDIWLNGIMLAIAILGGIVSLQGPTVGIEKCIYVELFVIFAVVGMRLAHQQSDDADKAARIAQNQYDNLAIDMREQQALLQSYEQSKMQAADDLRKASQYSQESALLNAQMSPLRRQTLVLATDILNFAAITEINIPGPAQIDLGLPPGVRPTDADLARFLREEERWTKADITYTAEARQAYINKFDVRLRPILKALRSRHAQLHYSDDYYLSPLHYGAERAIANDLAAAAQALP